MPYIGKQPLTGAYQLCDTITTSATATYNLTVGGSAVIPGSAQNCIVSLNGVIQAPVNAYTVSGSTITFASALTSSDVIDFIVILGNVYDIGTPSNGSVTNSSLNSNVITGQTAETSVAGGDSILIYDDSATALRKMTRTNFVSGLATTNGITGTDQWRLTADQNLASGAEITANWERVDTDGFGKIGTGMTESSGVFSFPSTGLWLIKVLGFVIYDAANADYAGIEINVTTDNSTYSVASGGYGGNLAGANDHSGLACEHFFNVTNTSTHKVKFKINTSAASVKIRGETAITYNGFSFIRLGDSV